MKNLKLSLIFGCFVVLFALFFNIKVEAQEYVYEAGTVEESYDGVKVNSFQYDYITKFTAKTNYYNGEEIYDDGAIIDENVNFYSGKSITIKIKHISKWFSKDDDKTVIYKYNNTRKDFNAKFAEYPNDKGEHTLSEDGLYKVSYIFDGSVKYSNYIYINSSVHEGEVVGSEKYENVSAFAKFEFKLSLKDAYDLRDNTYYYAFGTNIDDLSYTKFEVFTEEEKQADKDIKEINKELSVNILDKHSSEDGVKKKLFIKVCRTDSAEGNGSVFVTENRYELVSNVQAHISLVDENNNPLEKGIYFKNGDQLFIKVLFNAPVKFSDMLFSIDGGAHFFEIDDVTEDTTTLNINHTIKAEDYGDNLVFSGEFLFKTETSQNAIVNSNGVNIALKIVNESPFEVDMLAPVSLSHSVYASDGGVYNVDLDVKDDNYLYVNYYVKECNIIQSSYCIETYNSEYDEILKLSTSYVDYIENSSYRISFVIDERFGKYNGVNLYVFAEISDLAGNSISYRSPSVLVDNVIITEENKASLFVEQVLIDEDEETVIGKNLVVQVSRNADVSKVMYYVDGMEKKECTEDLSFDVGDKKRYNCLDVVMYDFSVTLTFEIEDVYSNLEIYTKEFKYSTMSDGAVIIGDYNFVTYANEEYDMSVILYNSMFDSENKIVLGENIINGISTNLKMDSIPSVSNLVKNLVFINGDEVIMIVEGVNDSVTIPSTVKLLEKLSHIEKYKNCASFENKCNIDLFLTYSYKTMDIPQVRYVKLGLVDNFNKYVLTDFVSDNIVDVNGTFAGVKYSFVTDLNVKIDENNTTKKINIIFEPVGGEPKVVETIDTSKLGVYKVSESYEYNGVSSYPLNYVVSVVDRVAPTIMFAVESEMTIKVGEKLPDHETLVSYSDNYDSNLELQYKIEPEFNSDKPGKYVISYWVVDSSGNSSDIIKLTVTVKGISKTTTYLIIGGIALFVIALIGVVTVREIRKERRK